MDVLFAVWRRCKVCITTTLRLTACASPVSRTEACRMTREEYNARARQVEMHVKDSIRAGNSRQCAYEICHDAVGRWRGRAVWPGGSAWRR